MKLHSLFLIAAFASASDLKSAEGPKEYLDYAIPPGASKTLRNFMADGETSYIWFSVAERPVGKETYGGDGQIIERNLFKDGKLHGVQRQWHPNGKPLSEAPYKEGMISGTCKHWNAMGHLVGCYKIDDGKGVRRIYNELGALSLEEILIGSKPMGLTVSLQSNGQLTFWPRKSGDEGGKDGITRTVYPDGSIFYISWPKGPYFTFSKSGEPTHKCWRIDGSEISENEYAERVDAARRTELGEKSLLPPYYRDVTKYKDIDAEEFKPVLEKYRKLQKVKIPLELDKDGNPVGVPANEAGK